MEERKRSGQGNGHGDNDKRHLTSQELKEAAGEASLHSSLLTRPVLLKASNDRRAIHHSTPYTSTEIHIHMVRGLL